VRAQADGGPAPPPYESVLADTTGFFTTATTLTDPNPQAYMQQAQGTGNSDPGGIHVQVRAQKHGKERERLSLLL